MRRFLLSGASLLAIFAYVGSADADSAQAVFPNPVSTTYIAPLSGLYEIRAVGAEGGNEDFVIHDASGGAGADITGEFTLTAGEKLSITVGRAGYNGPKGALDFGAGGGGGGTFVIGPNNHPLLIAGGGGGGGSGQGDDGRNAADSRAGGNGYGRGAGLGGMYGAGGQGGNPFYMKTHAGDDMYGGAGGGGFLGSGAAGLSKGGFGTYYSAPTGGGPFLGETSPGGTGGVGANGNGGNGGFGGGGGGAGSNFQQNDCGGGGGGGGGYSGGGGGGLQGPSGDETYCGLGGGAGGSYNGGANPTFRAHKLESGSGYVSIMYLSSSPVVAVPEPSTAYLLGAGAFGLFAFRRLRRR